MDFWLDSLLIGTVWCLLMALDNFMFGFRSCFRNSWRSPMASLSCLRTFLMSPHDKFELILALDGLSMDFGIFRIFWCHFVAFDGVTVGLGDFENVSREIGWVRDAHSSLYYIVWSIAANGGMGSRWGKYGVLLGAIDGTNVGFFRLLLLQ